MKYVVMTGRIDNEPRTFVVSADKNREIKQLREKGLKIAFRFRTKEVLKQGAFFINVVE